MLLAAFATLVLAVTPGAWIAFTLLDRSVAYSIRFALAVALSPFAAGVQLLILTWGGFNLGAATLVALLNLLAVPLMRPATPPVLKRAHIAPALCLGVMSAVLVALWLIEPNMRIYSWHNMMQAEAVYQLARLPALPEEMGLAGVRMHYPWFGHIQIAGVARLADISPFAAFPAFNLAALLAMFMLTLDAVLKLRPARLATASFVTTAVLLSTNLGGVLVSYVMSFYSMDIRLSTPTHKFLHFDLMTNGMALFSAVLVLALISVETLRARVWATTVICLTAIAFIYPLLLPSALILAGAALAVPHALRWLANGPLMPGPAKLLAGAALVVPIAALAGNLALLSNVETASPMALAGPADIKQSLGAGLFGAIAWAPILIPALFALWRTREPKRVTLVFAAGVSAVFFLALAMPEVVNYKFLVAAFLCLLPLVAEQLIVWLERRPRLEIPVAAAGFAVVALAVAPHVTRVHVPWGIFNIAPPITEAGFIVEPAEPERLAWITAIRDRTPEDTVILHPRSLTPIEVLAQRSSYVMPGDGEDARPGYTMPAEVILEEVKGYPHAIVGPRAEVLDRVYADDPEADFSSLTTELLALGRPVAVVLPPDAPYRAWLEASGRGAALHADAEVVVWLITAPSA